MVGTLEVGGKEHLGVKGSGLATHHIVLEGLGKVEFSLLHKNFKSRELIFTEVN